MDELIEKYQNLKISAFDKVRRVNRTIHNVTLGPNSTFEEEFDLRHVLQENRKENMTKLRTTTPIHEPAFDMREILLMKEMQRREQVQEAIMQRQRKFAELQQRCQDQTKKQWLAKQKELLRRAEQQELQILQALEEHEHMQNEQRRRYYQQLEEKRKQRDQELQAREQVRRDLQKFTKNQQEIGLLYKDIINILKSNTIDDVIRKPICEVTQKLKSLNLEMEEVTKKCKIGISDVEVQKSMNVLLQMAVLKNEVEAIINEYNKQKQQIKEAEIEKQEVTIPVRSENPINVTVTEQVRPLAEKKTMIGEFVSKASFQLYSELQEFLHNHQRSYSELLADDTLKQFKFDCKKAVNIPVNAISAVNPHHLLDKYNKLYNLLSGQPVPVGDSRMSAKTHPQGIAFCTDLLAKKFILQGDLMISSNSEAAFCYATIILSLWNEFPTFGKLLLAHFQDQCPYLVPIHLPRSVGQSDEEYYNSLGYQYVDGVVEKQDKFLKRMTGIMRLYSAIIVSKPKKSQQQLPHPHGLPEGWRWLTATLNLEPKTDITATLLHVFLETAGWAMQNAYKTQFRKLMQVVMEVYLPIMKKIDSGGPVTRLEVLLQEYAQKGHFPEPTGVLASNYW